jgi:hypothetical protein
MYTSCFICRRSLGTNASVAHLAIGKKIAFDVDRGRLWVVCSHCGQWCLTPIEERWEAIAECDALFHRAEARVSKANVALARTGDVDLIRIGTAPRDDIANWRYGPRFARRRRRARIIAGFTAVAAGGGTGVALYAIGAAALSTGSAFVGAWLLMLGTVYAFKLRHLPDWAPVARLAFPDGSHRILHRSDLPRVVLYRRAEKPHALARVQFDDLEATYTGDHLMELLTRVLPHANWGGASPQDITAAIAAVDRAEVGNAGSPSKNRVAWQQLISHARDVPQPLMSLPVVERFALEMAVAEEVERRAMSSELPQLAERWVEEEEIARTSDDMFLPRWIGDWIRAARRLRPRQGER